MPKRALTQPIPNERTMEPLSHLLVAAAPIGG